MKNRIAPLLMLAIAAFLFSCEKSELGDILGGESSRETTEIVETDGGARIPLAEDDSIKVKDRCDSLHMALKKAEKGSDQAKRLRKAIAENCKKRDGKAECARMMKKLKSLDEDSDEFEKLEAIIKKKCNCSKDGEGEKKERKEKGDKKDKKEDRDE